MSSHQPPRRQASPTRKPQWHLLGHVWLLVSALVVAGTGLAEAPETAQQDQVVATLGELPLLFIENGGHLDPQVAYYVQGSSNNLYFTPSGVTFALIGPANGQSERQQMPGPVAADSPEAGLHETDLPEPRQRWAAKLDFGDANPEVVPQAAEPQEAVISYFKGQSADWHTGLKTYRALRYPELWPGIDLVLFVL